VKPANVPAHERRPLQLFGRRRYVVLAFALLVVFWGSAFSVVKVGLEHSPPMIFAGLRTLVGGLAILLVAVAWGGSPHLRRDWPIYLLLAAFNVVFFFGFQTLAILYLPSGTAAVLEYLQPMLVGLLAWMILGESLSLAKVSGLILGFSGIVAVSAGSFAGNLSPAGVAFGAGSALSWALGTVLFKRYEARISTMWAVALPFVIGGVVLTLFSLATEPWSEVSPTGAFFASLSYVALVEIALAWLLWFGLIRAGEASRVAVYVFFVPLFSIVVGTIFLDERLTTSLLIGSVLIVTGIYAVNRSSAGGGKCVD
jgi:drug/metabolite transporter (DMT)-like permease